MDNSIDRRFARLSAEAEKKRKRRFPFRIHTSSPTGVRLLCNECGKPYFVIPARAEKSHFCSKSCSSAATTRARHAANRPVASREDLKVCTVCRLEKPYTEFYPRPETPDGLRSDCKACHNARRLEWLAQLGNHERKMEMDRAYYEREAERIGRENREWYASLSEEEKAEIAERNKEWRDNNSEYLKRKNKEKYWADPEASKARRRADYRNNKPRYIANARARDKRVKLATPPWADLKAIEEFYVEAARLSRETGIKHHVDHIFPLISKVMCGLHVEANLCVVPWNVNLEKGNKIIESVPAAEMRCCAWPTAAFLPGALDDVGSTA